MPFTSHKQMEYLKRHQPEVYKKWIKKYGKKVGSRRAKVNPYSEGLMANAKV